MFGIEGSRFIQTDMAKDSLRLSEERLNELVVKLRHRALTINERDELIQGHIYLAISIAGKYASRVPHLDQVFIADAMFAIVKAIEIAPDKLENNNLVAYLSVRINSQLFKTLTSDSSFRIPHSTCRVKKIVPPKREALSGVNLFQNSLRELRETIDACVKNTLEQEIVKLRIYGYNDSEIADMLQMSRQSVNLTRNEIRKRFEKMERE